MAFFSADAKCKVPTGESGYPITTVTRRTKAIVGKTENLVVANHHYSRLSFLPDAYLLHDIPDSENVDEVTTEESCDDVVFGKKSCLGGWYSGQVFYGFKSMITEGSNAMRCVVEISELTTQHFNEIPPCLYVYIDLQYIQ